MPTFQVCNKLRILIPVPFLTEREGAMVLAHSLRDHGTKAKLVVIVTLDSLKSSSIDELKVFFCFKLEANLNQPQGGPINMIFT